jgi:N-acetylmuramoyl-L-alanine amidase
VVAIQYLLRAEGYDLEADGIFDPATEAAVAHFQARQGLPSSGFVEGETWAALIREHELELNDRGDDVRALQHLLLYKCGAGIAVDGVFGESTRRAVIGFQSMHVMWFYDGIVGPTTWEPLIEMDNCYF